MSDNNNTSSGVGFTSLLLIAFIVLKLCNVIDWSWWWVLSPFWVPLGVVAILWVVLQCLKAYDKKQEKKVVTESGEIKSKWQERLEQMQEALKKDEEMT